MEDLTGKQLGSYQIISRLGAGGMATVFKAYQPKMERYVALKVLRREFSENPDFVSRFSQEARLIAQLEHPHILPVYDFGESDGYTYMAMRLVKGGALSDLLKKHGKLELALIHRIIIQVGGALDYAHEKGVIHRDFKPGNVLIDEFGSCLLTDFGIAKIIQATSHLTETGGILGTPFYISPEQGSGKQIDHRSDIYSLGIVLYHMTVGDVPYKADTPMAVVFKHVHDPLPLPRQQVPDLPEPIERVIIKAMAKNPEDRYATANELVKAFQNAMEQVSFERQAVQEPVSEPDPIQTAGKIPADQEILSARPSDKPKPEIYHVQRPEDIKAIHESKVKVSTRRRWVLGFWVIFILAGLAAAVWLYNNYQLKPIVQSLPSRKISNSLGMAFVYIPPGSFTMGSPFNEPGREKDEEIHQVTLTEGFYMQTTEVTLGQWRAFVRDAKYRSEAETGGGAWFRRGKNWFQKPGRYWDNPGSPQTEDSPVTCVSWNDVQKYIQWLSRKESKTYRLPTESEWEYACRAGSMTAFSNGEILEPKCGNDPHLNSVGWYCGNSNRHANPVAQKKPNHFGLYDMHGNVWEWCQDWYAEYPSGPVTNPSGPSEGKVKVRRGGSWASNAWGCRSACRAKLWPDRAGRGIGFRLVMKPEG